MMKALTLVFLSLLLVPANTFSQDSVKPERIRLGTEFSIAVRNGILSNEQIMKKYVIEGNYFKVDSVRHLADEFMDDFRTTLRKTDEKDVKIRKYSEHERDFAVSGVRDIGDDDTTPRRMRFSAVDSNGTKNRIDINDLYFVKVELDAIGKNEEIYFYVLFNDENRIVSYAGFTIGDNTGLMQF